MLDAHDRAGDGARLVGGALVEHDLDLLAADLREDLAEARVVGQIDREGFQRAVDRVERVVGDGGDHALLVLEDHALDQVVDVADLEGQVDAGVALDLALALEVADAAAEQHDVLDRQGGGRGGGVAGVVLRLGLGGLRQEGEHARQRRRRRPGRASKVSA